MDDNEVRDLLPLLALDALPNDEREEAEAMIGIRPDLRAELDEWRSVVGPMAERERRDPPPSLRAQVLAAVAGVPQEAPEAEPALPPPATDRITPPEMAPHASVSSMAEARARRSRVLAVAAAAVVVFGGAAVVIGTLSDSDDTADEIAAIVEHDDATTVDLSGQLSGLRITYVEGDDAAVVTGDGLPTPEGDRVYELWTIREGDDPQPVDIFRPDDDGDVEVLVTEMELDGTVIAVTEEPAGGTDVPTGEVIATSG